jgi:hypothetical protein
MNENATLDDGHQFSVIYSDEYVIFSRNNKLYLNLNLMHAECNLFCHYLGIPLGRLSHQT